MVRYDKIESDLRHSFGYFELESLRYLRDHRAQLIRGKYTDGDENGCMFWMLSRPLAAELRIDSKLSLLRYFTGCSAHHNSNEYHRAIESEAYQPARWLIRLVDGQICDTVRERYGDVSHLDWRFMLNVLDKVIAEREAAERQKVETERPVAERRDRQTALAC